MPVSPITIVCCLLIPVSMTSVAAAKPPITLEEAVAHVLAEHPELRAAKALLKAEEFAQIASLSRMLFKINLSDSLSYVYPKLHIDAGVLPVPASEILAFTPHQVGLNIFSATAQQPLLGLMHESYAYKAQHFTQKAAKAHVIVLMQQLISRIQGQFLQHAEQKALYHFAINSAQDLQVQVFEAQKRFLAGELTRVDILRLQAAAAAAKQKVIEIEGNLAASKIALINSLQLEQRQDIEFAEPEAMFAPYDSPSMDESEKLTLQFHPELQYAQWQSKAAHMLSVSQKLALLPEINFSAAYSLYGYHPVQTPATGAVSAQVGQVGFTANWPIWDFGQRWSDAQAARARARATQAQQDALALQLESAVATSQASYKASLAALESATGQLNAMQEAFRVVVAMLKAESASISELLAAHASLQDAQFNFVHAKFASANAKVALLSALGQNLVQPSLSDRHDPAAPVKP